MPDYQKMYHSLFNDVTDAVTKLQQAQQKTEEMYMDSKETVLTSFPGTSEKKTNDSPDKNPPPTKKKPPTRDDR
jgi:hypothetical protein